MFNTKGVASLKEQHIVLLHGLWMNGLELSLLRWRLSRLGYATSRFSYATVRHPIISSEPRLRAHVEQVSASTSVIHFVAHSLGGLLLRHYFCQYQDHIAGKVVTLASPHQGSVVATRLQHHWLWGRALGGSVEQALLGDVPAWQGRVPLGVLAGNIPMGMGRLLGGVPGDNDGTVALAETPLEGMSDYKVLPETHISMLISPRVVAEIHHFLQTAKFL